MTEQGFRGDWISVCAEAKASTPEPDCQAELIRVAYEEVRAIIEARGLLGLATDLREDVRHWLNTENPGASLGQWRVIYGIGEPRRKWREWPPAIAVADRKQFFL